jgi:hypothetical protein
MTPLQDGSCASAVARPPMSYDEQLHRGRWVATSMTTSRRLEDGRNRLPDIAREEKHGLRGAKRAGAMADVNDKIVAAWLEASKDLCIAVTAPYGVASRGQKPLLCEAFIPDFGSPTGAIAISARSRRKVRPLLREANRWHSELGDGYARYDRRLFIETLNDWGWFGQAHLQPSWYTPPYWA